MVNQLNIMLFSDHGMTKIQWMEKVIELDKYINMSDIVKMMDRGSVVSLWPKNNKYQEVRPHSFLFCHHERIKKKKNVRVIRVLQYDSSIRAAI